MPDRRQFPVADTAARPGPAGCWAGPRPAPGPFPSVYALGRRLRGLAAVPVAGSRGSTPGPGSRCRMWLRHLRIPGRQFHGWAAGDRSPSVIAVRRGRFERSSRAKEPMACVSVAPPPSLASLWRVRDETPRLSLPARPLRLRRGSGGAGPVRFTDANGDMLSHTATSGQNIVETPLSVAYESPLPNGPAPTVGCFWAATLRPEN